MDTEIQTRPLTVEERVASLENAVRCLRSMQQLMLRFHSHYHGADGMPVLSVFKPQRCSLGSKATRNYAEEEKKGYGH